MIDWRVENGKDIYSEEGWYFPSFIIQEYLIPLVNVGHKYIDEYNDTKFTKDDCMRIKGNIEYLLDSKYFDQKKTIKYDSFSKGVQLIDSEEIKDCLLKLYSAADYALETQGILKYYGD